MGCGCGKKAARPATTTTKQVNRPVGATGAAAAKVYQSSTMARAPKGPVTGRKTV